MMVVDAHAHVGAGARRTLTPDALLRAMDENGVAKAVVCALEQYLTVFNSEGNDYVAELVAQYPDRFIGFAGVNPWYLEKGVQELERSRELGLRGLKLNSALQGFFPHEAMARPLLSRAGELGMPVYFHTTTPPFAMPFQIKEVACLFPQVTFILGHCGFADGWTDVVAAARDCPNIYVETSLIGTPTLGGVIEALGADRVIFGSDVPESSLSVELAKIALLNLDEPSRRKILGANVLGLLEAGGGGN